MALDGPRSRRCDSPRAWKLQYLHDLPVRQLESCSTGCGQMRAAFEGVQICRLFVAAPRRVEAGSCASELIERWGALSKRTGGGHETSPESCAACRLVERVRAVDPGEAMSVAAFVSRAIFPPWFSLGILLLLTVSSCPVVSSR